MYKRFGAVSTKLETDEQQITVQHKCNHCMNK
jgi:hypothetical protein